MIFAIAACIRVFIVFFCCLYVVAIFFCCCNLNDVVNSINVFYSKFPVDTNNIRRIVNNQHWFYAHEQHTRGEKRLKTR